MQTQILIALATLLFAGLFGYLGYYLYTLYEDGQNYTQDRQIISMSLQSAPRLCGDGLFFDGEKCVDGDGNLPFVCEGL